MNKGLEALEKLASEHYHILKGTNEKEFYIFESNEYKTIETELKEREKYRKRCLELGERNFELIEEKEKQDEILRIIKENLQLKMSVDEDLGCLYVPLHDKNICVVGYVEGKDKIALLKEWLK